MLISPTGYSLFATENSDIATIAIHQKGRNFLIIPAGSARFGLLIETILIIIAPTGSLLLSLMTKRTSQRRMSDIDSQKR